LFFVAYLLGRFQAARQRLIHENSMQKSFLVEEL